MIRSPMWKASACPTCGSKAGESCGNRRLGKIGAMVSPHIARKRMAVQMAREILVKMVEKIVMSSYIGARRTGLDALFYESQNGGNK